MKIKNGDPFQLGCLMRISSCMVFLKTLCTESATWNLCDTVVMTWRVECSAINTTEVSVLAGSRKNRTMVVLRDPARIIVILSTLTQYSREGTEMILALNVGTEATFMNVLHCVSVAGSRKTCFLEQSHDIFKLPKTYVYNWVAFKPGQSLRHTTVTEFVTWRLRTWGIQPISHKMVDIILVNITASKKQVLCHSLVACSELDHARWTFRFRWMHKFKKNRHFDLI